MPHDAFISYSQVDKTVADSICEALENDGIVCWYAPRDVEVGDWDAAIMDALANCRVMILVWSKHSDQSRACQARTGARPRRRKSTRHSVSR